MTNKQLFELIEGMAILWENGSINDIKRAQSILSSIYRYAHIGHDKCNNKHEDWRKEAKQMYESLKGTII